jgi:hypothetical protein
MITAKEYFVDIEVEGKYKGEKTLFIVDYYNVDKIKKILDKDVNISQIYFGAGYQSLIKDFDVIRYFKDSNYILSLEIVIQDIFLIPLDILVNSRYHKIFTNKQDNFLSYENNITVKIENKLGITCFTNPIYNTWKSYNNA